jgi:hypothetical protein
LFPDGKKKAVQSSSFNVVYTAFRFVEQRFRPFPVCIE